MALVESEWTTMCWGVPWRCQSTAASMALDSTSKAVCLLPSVKSSIVGIPLRY